MGRKLALVRPACLRLMWFRVVFVLTDFFIIRRRHFRTHTRAGVGGNHV